MAKPKFKKGDRVKIVGGSGHCPYKGRFGTVRDARLGGIMPVSVTVDYPSTGNPPPPPIIICYRTTELETVPCQTSSTA